jgi:hypothetical protein
MPPLTQLEHGDLLLHRTFLRRQVTQLRDPAGSCGDSEVLGVVLEGATGGLDAGSEGGRGVKEDCSREGFMDGTESLGTGRNE